MVPRANAVDTILETSYACIDIALHERKQGIEALHNDPIHSDGVE